MTPSKKFLLRISAIFGARAISSVRPQLAGHSSVSALHSRHSGSTLANYVAAIAILSAMLCMVGAGASPVQAKGMAEPKLKGPFPPRAKPFEVTGEVVDSWCFTSQTMGPGRGDRHKACAIACAAGGVTLGIVDDQGNLYIAAKHKGYQGCKDLLLPFMAKRVHVVGWLAQAGGCNIMKIGSVTLAK